MKNRKEPTHTGKAPKTQNKYNTVLRELQPKTQNYELLKYLMRYKSITPAKAWEKLGIYRLSGRIYDLRNMGVEIVTLRCEVPDRHGEKKTVAKYVIDQH